MNEVQAIRANNNRRFLEQIERDMKELNRFYREYPYCPVCKCRAPKDHVDHIFEPMFSS